jgi:hypothetical protein
MSPNVSELLNKINGILNQSPVKVLSRLEYDLLMQHVRDLYAELDEARNAKQTPVVPIVKPVVEERIVETIQPEELVIKAPKPTEEIIIQNDIPVKQPVLPKQEVVQEVPKIEKRVEEPIIIQKHVEAVPPQVPLNERVKTTGTLNERLKAASTEIHHKLTTRQFKEMIDLNRRFVFVNELFNGNADSFAQAIQMIDATQDYDNAETQVTLLADEFGWDRSSQSAKLFAKLVSQKFGVE